MADTIDPFVLAFYLPQYHPVRINDANWGPGFTEWFNVVKAKPLFPGHRQPKLPGALGFYDLRCPEVLREQADLARLAGVDAFCFYYYRFGSQRVLERPLDLFLAHREIDVKFLYCWANEPWTKAWDGRSDDVLLEQSYGEEAFQGLLADLIRAMSDSRHVRIGNRPVFMIYQIEHLPTPAEFVARLRTELEAALGVAPLIASVFSHGFKTEMLEFLDFVVQFPPHRMPRSPRFRTLVDGATVGAFDPERNDKFEPYEAVVATALQYGDDIPQLVMGVTPDWDNSPRRPQGAHVILGSTPELFREWAEEATIKTLDKFEKGSIPAPLLFVNAWNEWGEGAILEPSQELGDAYLKALRSGVESGTEIHRNRTTTP